MKKRLTKHGNSNALIIDKAVMELLGIEEGGEVRLETDGKRLIVIPVKKVDAVSGDKKIQDAFEEVLAEYDDALEKLAK